MCLGSRTTQSPAASNTNYFGTNPWGDTPGGATPDITPPAVTTTAQGGSTGNSNLKIGGSGGKARIERTFGGPSDKTTKYYDPKNDPGVKSGGVNY